MFLRWPDKNDVAMLFVRQDDFSAFEEFLVYPIHAEWRNSLLVDGP